LEQSEVERKKVRAGMWIKKKGLERGEVVRKKVRSSGDVRVEI
jgi:hypothetical protein